MKSEIIVEKEVRRRKVYIISNRFSRLLKIIAYTSVFIGILLWLAIGFQWSFWLSVGLMVVWDMVLKKHFMSEKTLEYHRRIESCGL